MRAAKPRLVFRREVAVAARAAAVQAAADDATPAATVCRLPVFEFICYGVQHERVEHYMYR